MVLEPPAAIYHQPHSRAELAARPGMSTAAFAAWRRRLLTGGGPAEPSNGPQWGRHLPAAVADVLLVYEPL